jgi:bacterioferritin (cytochrome b1)
MPNIFYLGGEPSMFAVNQKVVELLTDKYHVELEKCESLREIVDLLEKVAQKEGLSIKHI